MKKHIVKVSDNGGLLWTNQNNKFHREDGPAIEGVNGHKEWWINGKRHRTDGPAIEGCDGYKAWFINDERHRDDGPAIEYPDGHKVWFVNGVQYTEEEFNLQTHSCHGKVVEIDGKRYQLKEI